MVPTDGLDSEAMNDQPGMAAGASDCLSALPAHSRVVLQRRLASGSCSRGSARTYTVPYTSFIRTEGYLTFNVEELLLLTLSTVKTRMISWLLMVRENFI